MYSCKSILKSYGNEDQNFKEEEALLYRRGEVKGRHEEALDVARQMKKEGFPIDRIVNFTKEEIEKLQGFKF